MNDPGVVLTAFESLFAPPEFSTEPDLPLIARLRELLQCSLSAVDPRREAALFNAMGRLAGGSDLSEVLAAEFFKAFAASGVLPGQLGEKPDADGAFLLNNALLVCRYLKTLPVFTGENCSILPGFRKIFAGLPDEVELLRRWLLAGDPLADGNVFTYRDGNFYPVVPDAVKPVGKFFGFPGVRAAYADHFAAFARGETNLPLLINSLPGYGKTSMVLSHALAHPGIIPVLASPETLEKEWERVVAMLAQRKDHRFILFFDDIDPRQIDWYSFRTNVGGAFAPPANVMPVLTANYEFHPSILSRGRKISYPVFDELRCIEMVEDFLKSFGMQHPPANLVSLIAADYTEEFGQKRFTELSPRTLMRYLKVYEVDPVKRRTMVALAGGEMITKPDAELFYEFNINLMRSLYGEEYIRQLLKERLKEL